METPKYYEFMNPILQALRDGGGTLTNEEIVDAVVSRMHLPDDVLERKQHGHNLGRGGISYCLGKVLSEAIGLSHTK
jgi:hypothetical protein